MVLEPYLLLKGLRFRVMGHFTTFPQGNDDDHRDAASPQNGMSVFAHGHGYLIKAPATIDPTKISMYQSNPIFSGPPLPKFVYNAQGYLCLPCYLNSLIRFGSLWLLDSLLPCGSLTSCGSLL